MMTRLSLQNKILIPSLVTVLLFSALSVWLLSGLSRTADDLASLYQREYLMTEAAVGAQVVLGDLDGAFSRAIYHEDAGVRASFRADFEDFEQDMADVLDELESGPLTPEERVLLERFTTEYQELETVWRTGIDAAAGGDLEAGRDTDSDALEAWDTAAVTLDELAEGLVGSGESAYLSAAARYTTVRTSAIAVILLTIGLALGTTLVIARRTARDLRASSHQLDGEAGRLASVSAQMGANAQATSSQADVVAAAGEQVSSN
ncbi:MAG: MCP four helix bundle domain-containing protein, partial [Nitriliruptoraceae bacterium]|nr:MCP four helix bundle domain-containing protein [Nitriliruptoraceae bacterium]